MGSYVDGALMGGEKVLLEGHISLWSMFGLILGGAILLPLFGAGLILWGIAYVRYKSTELAITNKRVIAKFGFIRRSTVEMNLAKVETLEVHQGIAGRIFNYGSLVISGGGNAQAPIPGISDPLAFRKTFMQAQDAAVASRQTPA